MEPSIRWKTGWPAVLWPAAFWWGMGLALTLCASLAPAPGPGGMRKRAESSTPVTGAIDIEKDGSGRRHTLDHGIPLARE